MVFFIVEPADDWDSVIDIEGEGEEAVVDDDGLGEIPAECPDIFDKPFPYHDTRVPVEPVLDEPAMWVDCIENAIGVVLF